MPPHLPPERSRISWKRLFKIFAILLFALGMLALLFPAQPVSNHYAKRVQALNDARGLATAIRLYQTEYGRLPTGMAMHIEDELTQAQLMRILRGEDDLLNPRKIAFFEARTADKRGLWGARRYKAGFHPKSGVFLDPWGYCYRVRLDSDYDRKVESPYKDGEEVAAPALVWSLGKDGVQGSPGKENILKDSDDVVSWR